MLISSIHPTGGENVTVTLSDGTEVSSTVGAVTDLRLYAGKDLDEEALEQFLTESKRFLALNKAVQSLSYRIMSCKELRDKLLHKGFDEDTSDFCVHRLVRSGLLCDETYCASVVSHCLSKKYGPERIRMELCRRGISEELTEAALAELKDPADDILSYIETHLSDPSDRKEVKKVSDALFRRGFSWDDIHSGINTYRELQGL